MTDYFTSNPTITNTDTNTNKNNFAQMIFADCSEEEFLLLLIIDQQEREREREREREQEREWYEEEVRQMSREQEEEEDYYGKIEYINGIPTRKNFDQYGDPVGYLRDNHSSEFLADLHDLSDQCYYCGGYNCPC